MNHGLPLRLHTNAETANNQQQLSRPNSSVAAAPSPPSNIRFPMLSRRLECGGEVPKKAQAKASPRNGGHA